jgi:hypothetical protein
MSLSKRYANPGREMPGVLSLAFMLSRFRQFIRITERPRIAALSCKAQLVAKGVISRANSPLRLVSIRPPSKAHVPSGSNDTPKTSRNPKPFDLSPREAFSLLSVSVRFVRTVILRFFAHLQVG